MDQHTLDVEDTVDAGHPAGAARLTETVCPSDAATLKDTVRPTAAAAPTAAALPRDAVYPVVNVRDPEAVWPSAPLSCSRRRLLLGCPGALVLSALVIGALCGPIALFTPTQTLPALTVTTSPCPGRKTAVSNTGCSHTTPQGPVFAKLLAKDEASLSNRTLNWHSKDGADSVYLPPSQDLRYEEDKRELVVIKSGLYCVSLQLKLSPASKNTGHKVQGWVSLVLQTKPQVDDLDSLGLKVELLPHSMEDSLVQRSWDHQMHLKAGHRLSVGLRAHLHGAQDAYKDWQLSQLNTTSFELFLCSPALHGNAYPHGCCRPPSS